MAKKYNTLEEAQAASAKKSPLTIPEEVFQPKTILEWKEYNGIKLPFKALNRKGEIVYYIRTSTGELIDVGIPELNEDGSFVMRSVARAIRVGEKTNLKLTDHGHWKTPDGESAMVTKPARTEIIYDEEVVYESKMETYESMFESYERKMSVGLMKRELSAKQLADIENRPSFLRWEFDNWIESVA